MSKDPYTVLHVYEGDGGIIIRDGGNISTFGVQSRAVSAAFEAASDEPALEHHVIADLAARLAKAERALEEAEKVIAPFVDAEIDEDARDVSLVSPDVCWITIGHLRAARKWMESCHD